MCPIHISARTGGWAVSLLAPSLTNCCGFAGMSHQWTFPYLLNFCVWCRANNSMADNLFQRTPISADDQIRRRLALARVSGRDAPPHTDTGGIGGRLTMESCTSLASAVEVQFGSEGPEPSRGLSCHRTPADAPPAASLTLAVASSDGPADRMRPNFQVAGEPGSHPIPLACPSCVCIGPVWGVGKLVADRCGPALLRVSTFAVNDGPQRTRTSRCTGWG